MDYEDLKRLGLDHYNIDYKKSFETTDLSTINHTIIIHLIKGNDIYCPNCGSIHYISRGSKSSYLKYATPFEDNITIKLYVRVYKCCDCHKEFRETNPFTHANKTITLQKDLKILNALREINTTYKDVAKKFNVSITYVTNLFDKKVSLKRLPLPEVLSIDEVYANHLTRYKYCCILYSPQRKKIIDVLDTRHQFSLISYFSRIPLEEKKNVKFVCMDMWCSYREVAKKCFPGVICCVDSFHICQNLTSYFDKIRLNVMRKYEFLKDKSGYYYWMLKKFYKFLYMEESKLPTNYIYVKKAQAHMTGTQILDYMLKMDKTLHDAYYLRQEYLNFNSTATIKNAAEWLDEIIMKFLNSNIKEYEGFIDNLKYWHEEIINSFNRVNGFRISNGPIERANEDIKTIFRISFGLRNFDRTRNRIMFAMNDNSPILYYRKNQTNSRKSKPRGPYKKNKNKL